jgi:hypothetical protein
MYNIFVLPFLPPLFFKHFTMTAKKEINVLKPQAIPGYAGSMIKTLQSLACLLTPLMA